MKKQLILVGLLVVGFASAQTEEDKKYQGNVGINTMKPQTTLDIAANTADGDKVEGLMIPRITYAKMQAMKANLTEYHDGLMVYVTDYMDINTEQSKDGVYVPLYYSPYFVYNKYAQDFFPFSPSGLTEVANENLGKGTSYMLSNNAMSHKINQSQMQIGVGAIDLSTAGVINGTTNAKGDYSFAAQGGIAEGQFSTALTGFAGGNYSFATNKGTAQGDYSTAIGENATATGEYSFAVQNGKALGEFSTAIGMYAMSQNRNDISIGFGAHASGGASFAVIGGVASAGESVAIRGRASGYSSIALGLGSQAKAALSVALTEGITTNVREFAFGNNFNTDTDVETDVTSQSTTRQIFSVGRDVGNYKQNALIILRNAHTGIGLPTDIATPANSKPTEMLDVNGNIKVRGTNTSITDGAACTNAGTISYAADGNFYGCTGQLVWKKLNN